MAAQFPRNRRAVGNFGQFVVNRVNLCPLRASVVPTRPCRLCRCCWHCSRPFVTASLTHAQRGRPDIRGSLDVPRRRVIYRWRKTGWMILNSPDVLQVFFELQEKSKSIPSLLENSLTWLFHAFKLSFVSASFIIMVSSFMLKNKTNSALYFNSFYHISYRKESITFTVTLTPGTPMEIAPKQLGVV